MSYYSWLWTSRHFRGIFEASLGIFEDAWRCRKMPKCLSLMIYGNAYKCCVEFLGDGAWKCLKMPENAWRCLSTNCCVEIYRTFGEDAWRCLNMPQDACRAKFLCSISTKCTLNPTNIRDNRHFPETTSKHQDISEMPPLYIVLSRSVRDKKVWQASKLVSGTCTLVFNLT